MTEWVPVALTRDIESGSATATTVAGAPVALWRAGNGTVHAWADRCPHRGMRLSLGFVRGDRLICLYHGWQFDADGSCRHIPAHPGLTPPSLAHTVSYRVHETGSIVWVAPVPGELDASDDAPLDLGTAVPACSVWIESDRLDGLGRALVAEAGFDVSGAVAVGEIHGVPVIAAIQIVTARQTALHTAVRDETADADVIALVVRWAHELRDRIGTAPRAVAS